MDDKWMTCTSCHALVQLNATGTCLGCQGGFNPLNEEDKYANLENFSRMAREMNLKESLKKPKKRKTKKKEGL